VGGVVSEVLVWVLSACVCFGASVFARDGVAIADACHWRYVVQWSLLMNVSSVVETDVNGSGVLLVSPGPAVQRFHQRFQRKAGRITTVWNMQCQLRS
jgi:hypothetical protein